MLEARRHALKVLLQMPGNEAGSWRTALAAALPEAEIALWPEEMTEPDYVLVWRPPAELFACTRTPKAIFNLGAGVDALLAVATLPRNVVVIRLTDAGMAEQMAEYVSIAVLRAYREMDAYAEQQRERCWQPRPRRAKSAFRVGLMGYGVLGRAIAAALRPFGFPLACWSRARQSDAGIAFHAGIDELDAFLSGVQVLVCTLPLTRQTTGLLDGSRLARLPRGAHVVNIARGELIVDADLVSLLDAGLLGGATLDVFRQEPLPSDHAFWHHPRVTLTPHVSAATLIDESVAQVAAKIRCLEQGLPVAGVIDRETGY